LGCVLGYWCQNEFYMPEDVWKEKLTRLGCSSRQHHAEDLPNAGDTQTRYLRWVGRVRACADLGMLPRAFGAMFAKAAERPTTVKCRDHIEDSITPHPQTWLWPYE
jgi:hypothetical protein